MSRPYLFAAARTQLPAGLGIALADSEAFEQVPKKPRPLRKLADAAESAQTHHRNHSLGGMNSRPSGPSRFFVQGRLRHAEHRRLAGRRPYPPRAMRCSFSRKPLRVRSRLACQARHALKPSGIRIATSSVASHIILSSGGARRRRTEGSAFVTRRVRDTVERIGQAPSGKSGALSFDYIMDDATPHTPHFIDANLPRRRCHAC